MKISFGTCGIGGQGEDKVPGDGRISALSGDGVSEVFCRSYLPVGIPYLRNFGNFEVEKGVPVPYFLYGPGVTEDDGGFFTGKSFDGVREGCVPGIETGVGICKLDIEVEGAFAFFGVEGGLGVVFVYHLNSGLEHKEGGEFFGVLYIVCGSNGCSGTGDGTVVIQFGKFGCGFFKVEPGFRRENNG